MNYRLSLCFRGSRLPGSHFVLLAGPESRCFGLPAHVASPVSDLAITSRITPGVTPAPIAGQT